MPIIQKTRSYQDLFASTTNYLRGNTGDAFTFRLEFDESIQVTSGNGDTINNNATTDIITWLGGSWAEEGFRNGDTISITIYNTSTGVVTDFTSTTIDWIQDDEMKVASTTSTWYDFQTEAVVIFVTSRSREGMELSLNFVGNGSQGTEFSLIDGNATRLNFDFKNNPGPVFNGTQFGERSGMFNVISNCELTASTTGVRTYVLTISATIDGLYNSGLFSFNNCLKLYAKMNWESLLGEPFDNLEAIYNDDADTGWFDMGFNSAPVDATLIQGINELAYDNPTAGSFVIESSSIKYAIGSAYVSGDDSYYKNQQDSQSNLSMIIPTQVPTLNTPINSFQILGRGYTLTIHAVIQTGNQFLVSYTFDPNSDFTNWIDARSDGDRTFYLWAKFGNTNVLVFQGQMTKAPAVTKVQTMIKSGYLDHSENVTAVSGIDMNYSGNVEDDIAFVGSWRNRFSEPITYFRIGIEAFNIASNESFTLQQSNVSFATIPQVSGVYVVNEVLPINTELPTTSVKRDAFLTRDTSIDTITGWGLKIYYPFLFNWRYWINQANANADFYPDQQTQNWVPYGGQTGPWRLRINMEYDRAGENFQYLDEVVIKDYETNPNLIQIIELKRASTNAVVDVVIEGELHKIVAQNVTSSGEAWNQATTWGMITIEPTEASPRWLSSTAIDFDGNTNNPLTPLSGLRCDLTFPSPDNARLECFFDPSKINLSNGVKITAKIKGCFEDSDVVNKLTTANVQKMTTSGDEKIKAI